MAIYDEILNHAGGNHMAAGDLHELLWERLLRKEDPRFHNVRVTRGDGGIDGFILKDPLLATATVFQTKFFADITSDDHREAIQDAFKRAHNHTFTVSEWILLLPISISHGELNWLVGGTLKQEAKKELGNTRHAEVDACAISYRLKSHLEDLCRRHLDVAAELLPMSSQVLLQKVAEERGRADALQVEIADRLRILNESMIRQRQVEVEKARSALKILYQGWGNHIGMLEQARQLNLSASIIEQRAADLEDFAERRTDQALAAEGLCVGVSDQVVQIYRDARMLRAVAVQAQIDPAQAPPMMSVLAALATAMRDFHRNIGEAMK